MKNWLRYGCIAVIFCSFILTAKAQEKTSANVTDNVLMILKVLGLDDSIELIERCESKMIARPRILPDGTKDTRLWDYIQDSRKRKTGEWSHDNVLMSSLWGHGKFSYRQTVRPSLQVVFYFKDEQVDKIVLDVDRFPPGGGSKVTSARHFIQEIIPNFFMRRKTCQKRMAGAIQRRYKLTNASSMTIE